MDKTVLDARRELVVNLFREFVGPGSEGMDGEDPGTERISESPLKRYALGILYPQKAEIDEGIDETNSESSDEASVEGELDVSGMENETVSGHGNYRAEADWESQEDPSIMCANQFCPSSYGMTFLIGGSRPQIRLTVKAAKYRRLEHEECYVQLSAEEVALVEKIGKHDSFTLDGNRFSFESSTNAAEIRTMLPSSEYLVFSRVHDKAKNFIKRGYRRESLIVCDEVISVDHTSFVTDSAEVKVLLTVRKPNNGIRKVTVSVVNKNVISVGDTKYSEPEKCFFQNSIQVELNSDARFEAIMNLAIASSADYRDELLYEDRQTFAVGHGCSVEWDLTSTPQKCLTQFLPIFEVSQTDPFPERIQRLGLGVFDMRSLAFNPDRSKTVKELRLFATDYETWINALEEQSSSLVDNKRKAAGENLGECRTFFRRILAGIELLQGDDLAWESFVLANQAMVMQRFHTTTYVSNPRKITDSQVNFVDDYSTVDSRVVSWRPFQLAFIVLSIKSIVSQASDERSVADLIWFPTGGGKTEAYLGVIAFTIFYRRLKYQGMGGGTAAIMRYTLRLLTSQQYERASTLIAACEFIRRRNEPHLGKKVISIGLWVGRDNTPNTQDGANQAVQDLITDVRKFRDNNPFQVLTCPWCGTDLIDEKHPLRSGYVSRPTFHLKCIEPTCEFKNGLPLQVVDDLLYKEPPSLLFATVDKFARLAWKAETMSLFGLQYSVKGQVERVHRPPEVILQDELHLISGPLGSMFGLYETAIEYLCKSDKLIPKIICSTATIKRASEHVKLLFNRSVASFPPSGVSITDSYFAKEIPRSQEPGRLFVGLMSIGITQTSAQVKALASLLYNTLLIEERVRDTYYTLVGYFNTLRELGHSATLIDADVKEKLVTLQARNRRIIKRPLWKKELTSRERSSELPKILKQLATERYPSEKTIPLVLTTNMFSAGVDISRLNLMFVAGQPKSTSEYIQSTSRVGRSDPGLVLTLYDGFRPRDRSHYENFKSFHQSFYRFVEPCGVTPFSEPARLRALHSLLVIVARLMYGLPNNADASRFTKDTITKDFVEFVLQRIQDVDKDELNGARSHIAQLIAQWVAKASPKLVYSVVLPSNAGQPQRQAMADKSPLIRDFQDKQFDAWPVLQSLRNVDLSTECYLDN